MSLLLSQLPTQVNPKDGYAYPRAEVPGAYFKKQRATALLLAACVLPPPQFVGSVRLVGEADANGLRITSNLPGPQSWSLKTFFYVPSAALGGGDHSVFTLEDSTPNAYQVVEISSAGDLFWNSFGGTALFLEQPIQRNRWFVLIVAIGTGGAGTVYWKPVSQPGALNSQAIVDANTTLAPAALTFGSNGFVEPFNGRFAGGVVWKNRTLTAGEAALEAASIDPVATGGITHWWKLEAAATKLVDSSGFGRNLAAKGAGTWTTEEGPLLAAGPWDSQLGPYPLPPGPVATTRRARADQPAFVQLVQVAPAVALDWLPGFPDFARALRRAVTVDSPQVFALDQFAVPPLAWAPVFPERARARARPVDVGGLTFTQLTDYAPLLSWAPTFPERVRGRQTPTRFDPPAVFALDQFAVPPLAWAPVFPERVRAARRAVEGGASLVQLVATQALALDWFPTYPDRVRATSRGPAGGPWYAPAVDQFAVPALAWAPTYPDRVRGRPPGVALGLHSLVLGADLTPPLAWLGVFPERVPGRRRALDVGLFATGWVDVVPSSSWTPVYPERARARTRPLDVGGPSLVQLVAPVVIVPMSWAPEYPVFVWRKMPTSLGAAAWVWVFEGTLPFSTGGASATAEGGSASGASSSGTPSKAEGPDDSTNAAAGGTPTKAEKT